MDAKLSRIENQNTVIEKNTYEIKELGIKLQSLDKKIEVVEGKVTGLQSKADVFEKDLQENNNFFDDLKVKTDAIIQNEKEKKKDILAAKGEIENLKQQNTELQAKMGEIQGKIIDMQCRNMKYNLIFSGIPEFENENCYSTLRSFMNDHLNVDAYNIAFANVHRIGSRTDPKRRGKPRSIIARFIYNDDLLMVKNAARKLKGKPY